MLDWTGFGSIHYFKELRVNRGFAATQLNDIWLAFISHDYIQHFFDFRKGSISM